MEGVSGGPGGPGLSYTVVGKNPESIDAATSRLIAFIEDFKGVVNVSTDADAGQREIRFSLRMRYPGLPVHDGLDAAPEIDHAIGLGRDQREPERIGVHVGIECAPECDGGTDTHAGHVQVRLEKLFPEPAVPGQGGGFVAAHEHEAKSLLFYRAIVSL